MAKHSEQSRPGNIRETPEKTSSVAATSLFSGTAKAVLGLVKADPKLIEAGADDLRVARRASYLETLFRSLAKESESQSLAYLKQQSLPVSDSLLRDAIRESRDLFPGEKSYDRSQVTDPTSSRSFLSLAEAVHKQCDAAEVPLSRQVEIQAQLSAVYQRVFVESLRSDAGQERFVLSELQSPFQAAANREQAWTQATERFAALARQPLLTDDLYLEDTYIPPRGFVAAPNDPVSRHRVGQLQRAQPLEPLLNEWFRTALPDDPIRFLLGGPGSGKSSLLKMFALQLVAEGAVRVLFIPMGRLRWDVSLAKMIGEYLHTYVGPVENPWERTEGTRRYLIIFDGLDELALQGMDAMREAENFPRLVRQSLPRAIPGVRGLVQCIISGRHLALDHLAGEFEAKAFFHLLPLYITPPDGIERMPVYQSFLEQPDLRDDLWRKLRRVAEMPDGGLPEVFREESLRDLSESPLSNILLWSAYREGGDGGKDWTRSRLFERHIRAVFDRRYDRGAGRLAFAYESFTAAMREAAVCAWSSGGSSFSLRKVRERCAGSPVHQIIEQIVVDSQDRPGPGLLAFHARIPTGDFASEPAVEFVLKPFSDYLLAQRILAEFFTVDSGNTTPLLAHPRLPDETILTGLAGFAHLTATGLLTREIARFVVAGLGELPEHILRTVRERATGWLLEILRIGIHPIDLTHASQIATIRSAVAVLLVLISSASAALQEVGAIPWSSTTEASLALRMANAGEMERDLFRFYLSWLDFSEQQMRGCDLRGVDLSHSHFRRVQGSEAVFGGARLKDAVWEAGNFNGAQFAGADLSRARMSKVFCEGTSFRNAVLTGARITSCQMGGCDFGDADMRGAILYDTVFGGSRMESVLLEDAYLARTKESFIGLKYVIATPDILTQRIFIGEPETQTAEATTLGHLGWQLVAGRLMLSEMSDTQRQSPGGLG